MYSIFYFLRRQLENIIYNTGLIMGLFGSPRVLQDSTNQI